MRLFDSEEVDEVAELIATTGRVLDGETDEFRLGCTIPTLSERAGRHSLGQIADLQERLRKAHAEHAAFRSRVEDALEAFVGSVAELDEEALDTLDELVEAISSAGRRS